MKYLIPFVIFLCVLSTTSKAQIDQFPTKNSFGRNNLTFDDIKGTPYLSADFAVGTVWTTDDVVYKDIPLRYNCYFGVMEFKKDNSSYELKPEEKIKRVEFGGQVFAYKEFEANNGGTNKSFCKVLSEGKALLCVRFSVKFYEPEPLKGFAESKPARFDNFTKDYYVSFNNSPAKQILTKKKLIEILADKKDKVESFISKQKLSVKKEEDLKKIVTYYNSL
jgi:hypothetical protein